VDEQPELVKKDKNEIVTFDGHQMLRRVIPLYTQETRLLRRIPSDCVIWNITVEHYRRYGIGVDTKGRPVFMLQRQMRCKKTKHDNSGTLQTRGGLTEVSIIVGNQGQYVYGGTAVCSVKDSYNCKIGREIALGRALNFACQIIANDDE